MISCFPGVQMVKYLPAMQETQVLIPGLGRSLGEGNGCDPLFLHLSWSYNPLPHWAPTDMHLYFYDFQVVQFFSIGRTSILYSSTETKKNYEQNLYCLDFLYIYLCLKMEWQDSIFFYINPVWRPMVEQKLNVIFKH